MKDHVRHRFIRAPDIGVREKRNDTFRPSSTRKKSDSIFSLRIVFYEKYTCDVMTDKCLERAERPIDD